MTDSKYAHGLLILDNSGSMTSIASDMNGSVEAFIKEQKKNFDGKLLWDVVRFDSNVEYAEHGVEDPKAPFIVPRGVTALLDGIGFGVAGLGDALAQLHEDERPGKVVVVVVTDGMENASREYTSETVKDLVETQQREYSWEFIFLGANIDSFSVAGGLGFAKSSTLNYVAGANGVGNTFAATSAYVTRAFAGQDASFSDTDREAAVQTQ